MGLSGQEKELHRRDKPRYFPDTALYHPSHSDFITGSVLQIMIISDDNITVKFSSVAQLCLTVWPHGLQHARFPYHQLLELTQTHVHGVGDAIQPFHPLSFPSPPAFNLSQHQGLFQRVSSSHQVAKVLELQLQHQSFQCIFRTDSF